MANNPQIPLSGEITAAQTQINIFRNALTGRDVDASGVFSAFPLMTPKYMKHRAGRDRDNVETLSRMYIQVAPSLYKKFLASLPDEETRSIAEILAGDDDTQGGVGYIDFLLQNVNHTLNEKVQIVETLGDYVAFFFGTSAPMWTYSGTLLNTYQDDWTMRMFRIFQSLGRGTQLAKNGQIMRIRYDSMIVAGAMVNFQWALNSETEMACPFSFNFLVKSVQIYYGGISSPTRLVNEKSFTHKNYHLEGSDIENSYAAQQTYLSGPGGLPAGVSEADQGLGNGATDATGTSQLFPENYDSMFGL
jgi:hypothetical protein